MGWTATDFGGRGVGGYAEDLGVGLLGVVWGVEGKERSTNLGSSHFCFCRRNTSVFPSIGEDGVCYFFHCPLDF